MKTPVDVVAPDENLVVAAILGDLVAFDALALRYRSAVVRTAQRIVPQDDAEDVAQETLLLAFKALPSLEELSKFPAWLHAITRRCAIRYAQKTQAGSRGRVPLDEMVLEQVPAIRLPMHGEDSDKELSRMLEEIPHDYALALQLHFIDEMPLKRIAGFLGVALTTVKWRIHQGKKLLRAQFRERTGRRE
jgi:RNA polymerase sigma-70 factor, ECF subfamily